MTSENKIAALAPVLKRREHSIHNTINNRRALKSFACGMIGRRKELQIERKILAQALGISYKQLSHIENGDHWPSLAVYLAICRALKCEAPPLFA